MNRERRIEGVIRVCLILAQAGVPFMAALAAPLPLDKLESALANAQPGDTLVVADGNYSDVVLELRGKGTQDEPITIKAQSAGGVIFSGQSAMKVEGEYLILGGFFFKEGYAPKKTVIALEGSHCRLTETVIDDFNPPDLEREDKWVTLRGKHLAVDYCTFRSKKSASVTLTVWRDSDAADHHHVLNNHFHTRPKGEEGNGYETIRIGTSDTADSNSHTSVLHNLFEYCDGEMEAISVKAGSNTISGNTFHQCAGTLTLRHGNGSRVERNLFAGKRKEGTGGIRVYGANHVLRDNIFIGTMARGGGAVALMAGNPDPRPHEFQRAENVVIERNLFAANRGPAIKLGEQYQVDGRTLLPRKIVIQENTLTSDDLPGLVSGADFQGLELTWERNQIFRDNEIPRELTRDLPRPLNKTVVGAAWYRDSIQ